MAEQFAQSILTGPSSTPVILYERIPSHLQQSVVLCCIKARLDVCTYT